ncbi:MAG: hypothetical protein HY749_16320 [Gammaproteobacteria bacterium]|nr:hypothetical protein [Gammaproteobacteria bacterium]
MILPWFKTLDLSVTKILRLKKTAVIDVDGTILSVAELKKLDVNSRIVVLDANTTLSKDAHDNKVLVLNSASARTHTLPAATGSGARFQFIVGAVNTSGYVIQVTGDDTIDGVLLNVDTDTSGALRGFTPSAADDTVTLNGTTQGGASIGDVMTFVDIAADQWAIDGRVSATGSPATPFSSAVT